MAIEDGYQLAADLASAVEKAPDGSYNLEEVLKVRQLSHIASAARVICRHEDRGAGIFTSSCVCVSGRYGHNQKQEKDLERLQHSSSDLIVKANLCFPRTSVVFLKLHRFYTHACRATRARGW